MPFDGEFPVAVTPAFTPAVNAAATRRWIGPGSVAAHFRVVECRRVGVAASQEMVAAPRPTPPAEPAFLQPLADVKAEQKQPATKAVPVVAAPPAPPLAPPPAPVAAVSSALPIVVPEPKKDAPSAKALARLPRLGLRG